MKKVAIGLVCLLLVMGGVRTVDSGTFRLEGGEDSKVDLAWAKTRGELGGNRIRILSRYGEQIPEEARWILVGFARYWRDPLGKLGDGGGSKHYQYVIERPPGKDAHVKITHRFFHTWGLKPTGKSKNNISKSHIKKLKENEHFRIV